MTARPLSLWAEVHRATPIAAPTWLRKA